MKDIKKDLAMLYQGTDMEKLQQPKERYVERYAYALTVLGGIILMVAVGYFWYLVYKPL